MCEGAARGASFNHPGASGVGFPTSVAMLGTGAPGGRVGPVMECVFFIDVDQGAVRR